MTKKEIKAASTATLIKAVIYSAMVEHKYAKEDALRALGELQDRGLQITGEDIADIMNYCDKW